MSPGPDGTLDAFITNKVTHPEPISISQEIRDRGSIFVGHIYRATTLDEAKVRISHLKHYVHRQKKASHEIAAWRLMVLKAGKTGLEGPSDFELVQGSKDDGESWAGGKVLKVMQNMAVIDAVVVVSRWYGGTLLGPARFQHIETCATEVCKIFKQTEELQDCITTLRMLDDMLREHRKKLEALKGRTASKPADDVAASSSTKPSVEESRPSSGLLGDEGNESESCKPNPTIPKVMDYSHLDVAKAKRLIKARESSIQSVSAMIEDFVSKNSTSMRNTD